MSGQYILCQDHKVLPAPDLMAWGKWMETANRHVAEGFVHGKRISTVFLGLDHNFEESGPPILWETMVFEGNTHHDLEMDRCSGNWEQAEAMHAEMVEKVKRRP